MIARAIDAPPGITLRQRRHDTSSQRIRFQGPTSRGRVHPMNAPGQGYLGAVLTSGSTIAGYRIERVIGSGQMGTIYLARSPDLPRKDALKVLNRDFVHDPDFRVRFLREADVAAQLSHPNVVTVFRRGATEDGLLWIAMQYVDGTDADTALREGRMTPVLGVHTISEIAKALDYAHRQNVIHRDVKPANFLLSDDFGTDTRVLLGDFGIAHSMGQAQLVTAGSVLATVAYAAPEVLYGKPVDGRADLYSLGCSLFRLLTGRTPFRSEGDTATIIRSQLQDPPPLVTDFAPDLAPAINDVIRKALATDPDDRYQTGRELAEAAAEALGISEPAPALVVAPTPIAPPNAAESALTSGAPVITPARQSSADELPQATPGPAESISAGFDLPPAITPRRRRPTRQAAAVIGVLAVAASALTLWLTLGDHGEPGSQPADAHSNHTGTRDADAEARLMRTLPPGYPPGGCEAADPPDGATAEVNCATTAAPDLPITVSYSLMSDSSTLKAKFDRMVADASAVTCPGNIQSPGAWRRNATPQLVSGTLFCGVRPNGPIVGWTTDDQLVLASAQPTQNNAPPATLDAIYAWWSMHS